VCNYRWITTSVARSGFAEGAKKIVQRRRECLRKRCTPNWQMPATCAARPSDGAVFKPRRLRESGIELALSIDRCDQSGFHGVERDLEPISQPELLEDIVKVGLHRTLADGEQFGDFGVA
jgi:hypothetical protein